MQESLKVKVRAVGRDSNGGVCVDLRIQDGAGRKFKESIRLTDLVHAPHAIITRLANAGIAVLSQKRQSELLKKIEHVIEHAETSGDTDFQIVTRSGWHDRHFVTPYRAYGRRAWLIRPQINDPRPNRWEPEGNLTAWQDAIQHAGDGNSLVVFAICAAFVPPLLALMKNEGAGFMLVGETSTGKSTISGLMASVWGGDPQTKLGFAESWNATANAIELLAMRLRDSLLVLDDTQLLAGSKTSQAETLARAIFGLTTGIEKARHTTIGPLADWRLIYWATSNSPLREILADGKVPYDASMSARLIEIPVAGRFGVFNQCPEGFTAAEFSKWLRDVSCEHYGVAIDQYLHRLTRDRRSDEAALREWINARMQSQRDRLAINGAKGLDDRVADIFALVYAAGRLAAKYGVLPWKNEELRAAVASVYWQHRDFVNAESATTDPLLYMQKVIADRHVDFVDIRNKECIVREQLLAAPGIITKSGSNDREFSFLPNHFRDIFAAEKFSPELLIQHLKNANFLICDAGRLPSSRKNQTKRNLKTGGGRERVYCISGTILDYKIDSHA